MILAEINCDYFLKKKASLLIKIAEDCQADDIKNILRKDRVIVVGISLGNPYFDEENLQIILTGLSSRFDKVAVLLADKIAIHNYRAMGYPEKKAHDKVRKKSNHMINRVTKVINNIEENLKIDNIFFYQWDEIESLPLYHECVENISNMYQSNNQFSLEVYKTTLSVMEKYITDHNNMDAIVEEAKWYYIKELAFALCACDFFNSSVLTSYYTDIPLYRKLLAGDYINQELIEHHDIIMYECIH